MKRSKFAPSEEMSERSSYLGKAGEHLVLAQLLLREMDASLLEVDRGVDLFVSSGKRISRIQVKTRTLNEAGITSLYFSKKTLERKDRADFFVFVAVAKDNVPSYFIFPTKLIVKFIRNGTISEKKGYDRYDARIFLRDGAWYMKNYDFRIGRFLDAWNLIK